MAPEKSQTEKLEEALYSQWAKKQRFILVCGWLGFSGIDLHLISSQYTSFGNN